MGMLLKRIIGWSVSVLLLENSTSTACFCGSELKDFLQTGAHWLISCWSWFTCSAASWALQARVNKDVSVKSFEWHFKSAVRSFMYTRRNNCPKKELWDTPATTSPQSEHPPFRTICCFRSLGKLSNQRRKLSRDTTSCHLMSIVSHSTKYFRIIKVHGTNVKSSTTAKCLKKFMRELLSHRDESLTDWD